VPPSGDKTRTVTVEAEALQCLTGYITESLVLVATWVLASSQRRIQARCENVIKVIVKFVRKKFSTAG
jgi:hypothetical protein